MVLYMTLGFLEERIPSRRDIKQVPNNYKDE
jgi:hypothetical protein